MRKSYQDLPNIKIDKDAFERFKQAVIQLNESAKELIDLVENYQIYGVDEKDIMLSTSVKQIYYKSKVLAEDIFKKCYDIRTLSKGDKQ